MARRKHIVLFRVHFHPGNSNSTLTKISMWSPKPWDSSSLYKINIQTKSITQHNSCRSQAVGSITLKGQQGFWGNSHSCRTSAQLTSHLPDCLWSLIFHLELMITPCSDEYSLFIIVSSADFQCWNLPWFYFNCCTIQSSAKPPPKQMKTLRVLKAPEESPLS